MTAAASVRIILVRHGQTAWNDDRYIGREDVSLNATGKAQAARLVEFLAAEPVDAIWSSPLARARETCAPLAARRRLTVTTVDDLLEMDYGSMQGVRKRDRRMHIKDDHIVEPIPGGESLTDVSVRTGRVYARLARELVSGTALVLVGHYRASQFLLGHLSGRTFEEVITEPGYRPDNGTAYAVDCVIDREGRLAANSTTWLIGDERVTDAL